VRLALVHGFTQTGRSWAPIASRLRANGHEVVTPDAPGHGAKATVEADLWRGADLLADEVGRAIWIGYSMGGRLCLHLALRHPDLVEGLVVVSTTAGIDDPQQRAARRRADDSRAATIAQEGVPAFIQSWLSAPMWATLREEDRGVDERLTNTAEGLASSLRHAGTGTQEPLWDRLHEIKAPVLVVSGELDATFTAAGDRAGRQIGARATRQTLAGVGHAVPWEAPAAFVEAVETWLETTTASQE